MKHRLALLALLILSGHTLEAHSITGSWYDARTLQKVQDSDDPSSKSHHGIMEGFRVWYDSDRRLCYEANLGMYGFMYAENVYIVPLSGSIVEIRFKSRKRRKTITLLRFFLLSKDTGYIVSVGGPPLPELRNWVFKKAAPDPFPYLWQSGGTGTGLPPLE